ncbi:SUMO-specific isopeptidase USPL1 [Odontesthes bonariensis]|uniref:SUMO-specific isopeptidase USPL1 n=1 Tax=Odontesthes bonariensis TaxID=219752 RepID=UPI003F58F37A
MVILSEWHRTALDPETSSCLPMTGEDTGLGALASPLAGYLGKVQERAASLEYCPWCTTKGFAYALRSYHINLQESISLCTNPQCLFPLVTRPLEDVLASLDPVEPTVGNKRKNAPALEMEELMVPPPKCLRSSEVDGFESQNATGTPVSPAEHGAVNLARNGQHATPYAGSEKLNGYHNASVHVETTGWISLQDEDVVQEKTSGSATHTADPAPPTCLASVRNSSEVLWVTDKDEPALSPHAGGLGLSENDRICRSLPLLNSMDSRQDTNSTSINIPSTLCGEQTEEKSPIAEVPCKNTNGIKRVGESDDLVSVPEQLFWSNRDNLCWLDSLLAALVNCKSLKCKPEDEPRRSSVWQLIKGYEDICASIQEHQQTGQDGAARVPRRVLHKANVALQSLRMSVFKLLQPKLHCKLGQKETPVFAMPLLLTMDSWVEHLFQSTFQWEFKCSKCKVTTKESVRKTLPTFTNIVPDWHPLHAVHFAPCNMCSQKNQRRTMLLERVPPVFALHFVEGLPDNDVSMYTFNFKGKRYSVTTVIQYCQQLKHFVAWISNGDGSWLEYDDLKHPDCKAHGDLPIPAHEMHVVFWEVEEDAEPSICSPSTTYVESPPPEKKGTPSLNVDADEPLARTSDQSLLMTHNDSDIVCALSGEDGNNSMDTTIAASVDTSIGTTTLLDTFEGLSHDDIVTLTLVELKADSEMPPSHDNQQTQDSSVPAGIEKMDSAPDGSSPAAGSHVCSNDVEPPTIPSSSDTDSKDGSCSDPTNVPGAKRARGRRNRTEKAVRRGKKAASHSSPVPLEPCEAVGYKSVSSVDQDNMPPVETPQQASPPPSTDASPHPVGQKSPTEQSAFDQHSRWSYLLSKHPLKQVHTSTAAPAPTHRPPADTRMKSSPPVHSTPNPAKRQPVPVGLPKPQLSTEESDGLPPKAAEMYGGFGTKSAHIQSPLPPPALLSGKSKQFQPIASKHQTYATVISGASPPALGAKQLSKVQLSKGPPGLSDTEALRYKLIKKLKAKKKKLAKLNNLLGNCGGARLQPDSTDLNSPSTVTSSTYDGSACDDFLSDLLSPSTTASNLSPDSTGFLELLAGGQDGVGQFDCVVSAAGLESQNNCGANGPDTENFLEDFFSQCFESG